MKYNFLCKARYSPSIEMLLIRLSSSKVDFYATASPSPIASFLARQVITSR